ISYSVTEEAITFDSTQHSTGYTTTYNNEYIVDEVKGTEVINTHEPEKTSISGTKTWKDNNNAYSTRPESITINLLKNGVKVDSTTAPDKDGNWTYSFTDLDKYENGNLIIYSLSEEPVKDYKTTTEEGNPNNFINTLSRITSITGQKSWNDNDITEYRPGSLILVLYRNGTEVGRETVNSTSNWSNTWNNLDEFDENGVKYNYTVDESDPDGTLEYYTKEQTGDENNNYTVKNKLETTKVKVTKEWIDDNNSQDTRPENIKVYLYKNGGTEVFKEATIEPKDGKWEYTFEDLPKQSNGEDIVYTVDEVVPPKYAKVSIEGDMNSGYTITNKVLDSITKEYPVKKTWIDDGNRDGLRTEITVTLTGTVTGTDYEETYTKSLNEGNNWEDTFTDIPVFNDGKLISYQVKESEIPIESPHTYGYDTEYNYDYSVEGVSGCEIINTHDPEKIKISGTKKWDDFDDEDEIRPDTITINLIKNGNSEPFATKEVTPVDGSWEFEFSDLYKFENGQKVNYTIEEVVPEGYTREIKPDEEGINVEVINTHMPKVTFNIHKDWNDYDNNDGKRPDSITVRLLRNGTEITNTTITGPSWSTSFKDLDKYDSEGNEYDYTIKEDTVEFYAENPLIEYGEDNNVNITNTHELIKLEDIIVKKVWKDDNNKNNSRPASIHINLLADGVKVDDATLSESNGWTYTFKDKLKYNAGKEIVYTVTEDAVKGYDTSINGYEITNTYNEPVIEITPPNTGISIDTTKTDSDMSLVFIFMITILGFLLRKKYN
ncbi:MAG: Cna B-type domain-containing protein, partial [Bacilli bacterium]|nr:Cna B-type domain-containing protein [Bacilli bacterium]